MDINRPTRRFVSNVLAVLCLGSIALPAQATTVSPVVADIKTAGRGVVQSVSVANTGASALPVEITVTELRPTTTGFEPIAGSKTDDDILVSPPSALIPAGQTQTFRVQWIGDPELNSSKHYYVSVNQLPVKLPAGQSAVQVVYNFQVLVSVSSNGKKPEMAIASATQGTENGKSVAAITVRNAGQAHDYISQHRLKITETSASGAELFSRTLSGSEFQSLVGYGLVASGQTRTVNVPLDKPVPAGAKLTAVLLDERAQ